MGEIDDADVYGTFTNEEADAIGVMSADLVHGVDASLEKNGAVEFVTPVDSGKMSKFKGWFKG